MRRLFLLAGLLALVPLASCRDAEAVELDAMRVTARTEGILLDPIYTGKAMSGLIGLAREDAFAGSDGVCFWHTGGLPALFAFEDEIMESLSARE